MQEPAVVAAVVVEVGVVCSCRESLQIVGPADPVLYQLCLVGFFLVCDIGCLVDGVNLLLVPPLLAGVACYTQQRDGSCPCG
eukprot:11157462-Ditylum_brightwellii.AAC.1